MARWYLLALGIFAACFMFEPVVGHGYLYDPPARNAAMNLQFKKKEGITGCNLGDITWSISGQFCGGRTVQEANGGKCSACGDNYATSSFPRPHDYGGSQAKQITPTRVYLRGQNITVKVQVTAQHLGYFYFNLCPILESDFSPNEDMLTKCYQDSTMYRVLGDFNGNTEFGVIDKTGSYTYNIKLPDDITCPQGCNFQWVYVTGNSPGSFPEHFVNCADIAIIDCEEYPDFASNPTWCGLGPTAELTSCSTGRGGGGGSSQGGGTSGGEGTSQGGGSTSGGSGCQTTPSNEDGDWLNPNDGCTDGGTDTDTYGGTDGDEADDGGYDEGEGEGGYTADGYGDGDTNYNGGTSDETNGGGGTDNGGYYDNGGADDNGGNYDTGDNYGADGDDGTGTDTGVGDNADDGNTDDDVADDFNDDDDDTPEDGPSCAECTAASSSTCDNPCCVKQFEGHTPSYNSWCSSNCNHYPPYCPSSFCQTVWNDACYKRKALKRLLMHILSERGITLK